MISGKFLSEHFNWRIKATCLFYSVLSQCMEICEHSKPLTLEESSHVRNTHTTPARIGVQTSKASRCGQNSISARCFCCQDTISGVAETRHQRRRRDRTPTALHKTSRNRRYTLDLEASAWKQSHFMCREEFRKVFDRLKRTKAHYDRDEWIDLGTEAEERAIVTELFWS